MKKKTRLDPKDVDYKNLAFLRKHLTENGKIISAGVSGLDVRSQRIIGKEIKRARQLAMLPYVDYKHTD